MITGSSPGRVLVADDDDLVRLVLRRALERHHLVVTEAASGAATVQLADNPFDLAIVDAHMPGADLTECLTALRSGNPGMPLLVLSGDASAPRDPALPEFHYLAKPVNLDEFLATVTSLMGGPGAGS